VFECASGSFRERPSLDGVSIAENAFQEDSDPKARGDRFCVLSRCCEKRPVDGRRLEDGLRAAAIPSMNLQCCLFFLGTMKARVSIRGLPAAKGPFEDVDLGAWLTP
jgi:hypothetical protein